MTDKIITTFETTITWINPEDSVPAENRPRIIFVEDDETFHLGFYEPLSHTFYGEDEQYKIRELKYWAYLPKFD